jgi:crossover junction endodeoxyribonuclease RuvC
MQRVLGIDPGSHHLGWGVVEVHGTRLVHVDHGICRAPRTAPLGRRLATLYEEFCSVLDEFRPDEAGLEKVFSARNVRSALTLGHARGMVLMALAQRDLVPGEYAPSSVKAAVGAHGHGGKDQVALMVGRLLGVDLSGTASDASDALAIALCHAHDRRRQRFLSQVEGGS